MSAGAYEGLGESIAEASAGAPGGRQVFPELVEHEGWEETMRRVAREEIASMAGLALKRLQNAERFNKNPRVELLSLFGELLNDFGKTEDEPGPKTLDVGGEIAPEGEVS